MKGYQHALTCKYVCPITLNFSGHAVFQSVDTFGQFTCTYNTAECSVRPWPFSKCERKNNIFKFFNNILAKFGNKALTVFGQRCNGKGF